MDTQLLTRILQEAQDRASNASEADAIRCLAVDLNDLDTALSNHGLADFREAEGILAAWAELAAHAQTQPFDTLENENDPHETLITSLEPSGFEEWLGELERLAQ